MTNTVENVSNSLRSLVSLVLLGLMGAGGWIVYSEFDKRALNEQRLREANVEIAKLAKENERLDLANRLLKVDHRVARIDVLDQQGAGADQTTTLRWTELTTGGEAVDKPKTFTIDGDRVYVDALVIKYDDSAVESGDPIRATSVCLFQRLFGEHQKPSDGFPLDPAGSRPSVYSQGDNVSSLEKDVWANFWDYANNPAKRTKEGIRAAHGEAPNIRLQPGHSYRLDLRSSGGLTIQVDDAQK